MAIKRRKRLKPYIGARSLGDITRFKIAVLGRWGFYASTIVNVLDTNLGIHTTVNVVYGVLKASGVKTTAYRRGTSPEAEAQIERLLKTKAAKKVA